MYDYDDGDEPFDAPGTYPYGHNPYGAMFGCDDCGRRFRTSERLQDHQVHDAAYCQEMAALRDDSGSRQHRRRRA